MGKQPRPDNLQPGGPRPRGVGGFHPFRGRGLLAQERNLHALRPEASADLELEFWKVAPKVGCSLRDWALRDTTLKGEP